MLILISALIDVFRVFSAVPKIPFATYSAGIEEFEEAKSDLFVHTMNVDKIFPV